VETARSQKIELPEDEALVSLVGIEQGSNRLTFSVVPLLTAAASTVSQSVEGGDYSSLPLRVHRELHKISQQAEKRKWALNFIENPSLQIRPATISSEKPVPEPSLRPLRGSTILYGRCMRVGGVHPRAEIRELGSSKLLFIDVSESIARTLARCLYEEVALEGEASWDPETWEIQDFKAVRMTEYRAIDPIIAFRELAEAAGDRWDNVDAEGYVRDLRSTGSNP